MRNFAFTSYDQLPLTLNAEQVAQYLNISRGGAYALLHTEGVPTIKLGKRLLIQRDALLHWLNEQQEKTATTE